MKKCPQCGEELFVKLYKNLKVVSCEKCDYSRREKIEKAQAEETSAENEAVNEIDILNQLDEQNEQKSNVIGLGLAGAEATYQLSKRGILV